MSDERDAFYVVRKGDIIGVYKGLSDFQSEIHASVYDRPVSVYKGHGLFEDAKNHLLSCGFSNASYCISVSDMKDELFGQLTSCNFEVWMYEAMASLRPYSLRMGISVPRIGNWTTSYTPRYSDASYIFGKKSDKIIHLQILVPTDDERSHDGFACVFRFLETCDVEEGDNQQFFYFGDSCLRIDGPTEAPPFADSVSSEGKPPIMSENLSPHLMKWIKDLVRTEVRAVLHTEFGDVVRAEVQRIISEMPSTSGEHSIREPPDSLTVEKPDEDCPPKRSRTQAETQDISCILKFDGASKGNPGPSGAGAVLYDKYGSLLHEWAEGVGVATNNVAEYRGLILGLKKALEKGFRHIKIHGDSNLVVMQVQGKWKLKNKNMADLCGKAIDILTKFESFDISYIPREMNSEADKMANSGIHLRDGEVSEVPRLF